MILKWTDGSFSEETSQHEKLVKNGDLQVKRDERTQKKLVFWADFFLFLFPDLQLYALLYTETITTN